MNKSTIVTIIYVIGIIISALVFGLWDAETGPKALIGVAWTAIFLIALFYADKNEEN